MYPKLLEITDRGPLVGSTTIRGLFGNDAQGLSLFWHLDCKTVCHKGLSLSCCSSVVQIANFGFVEPSEIVVLKF